MVPMKPTPAPIIVVSAEATRPAGSAPEDCSAAVSHSGVRPAGLTGSGVIAAISFPPNAGILAAARRTGNGASCCPNGGHGNRWRVIPANPTMRRCEFCAWAIVKISIPGSKTTSGPGTSAPGRWKRPSANRWILSCARSSRGPNCRASCANGSTMSSRTWCSSRSPGTGTATNRCRGASSGSSGGPGGQSRKQASVRRRNHASLTTAPSASAAASPIASSAAIRRSLRQRSFASWRT